MLLILTTNNVTLRLKIMETNNMKKRIAIFIYFALFCIFCLYCYSDRKDTTSNYKIVNVGEGVALVPIEYWDTCKQNLKSDYCYLETDECQMIMIDYPVKNIDQGIENKMGISDEIISKMHDIKSEIELKDIFSVKNEDILHIGTTDKPSFQSYMLVYEKDTMIISVFVFHKDNRSMFQIISSEKEYFSDKEYMKMYDLLHY